MLSPDGSIDPGSSPSLPVDTGLGKKKDGDDGLTSSFNYSVFSQLFFYFPPSLDRERFHFEFTGIFILFIFFYFTSRGAF